MMLLKQIGVFTACGMIGAALFFAPRTVLKVSSTGQAIKASQEKNSLFEQQIKSVKENLNIAELSKIELFEERFNSAQDVGEKAQYLDSLISTWDQLMRPGIAAEYQYQKAEITNQAKDWEISGERYVQMISFFEGADKKFIAERGIYCLEQAMKGGANRDRMETLIAIANVEGSDDPMSAILKLRSIAESNPNNLDAQLNLGFFSMQTAQYDKAIERFNKVLIIDPNYLSVRFYLSEAYLAMGNKSEAVKQLNLFLNEVNPDESLAVEEAKKRLKNINI